MHVDLQNTDKKRSLRGSDRARKHSPIDWPAIEVDFRGGMLSLRDMALKHGCSHSTIANHACLHKWIRTVECRPMSGPYPGVANVACVRLNVDPKDGTRNANAECPAERQRWNPM